MNSRRDGRFFKGLHTVTFLAKALFKGLHMVTIGVGSRSMKRHAVTNHGHAVTFHRNDVQLKMRSEESTTRVRRYRQKTRPRTGYNIHAGKGLLYGENWRFAAVGFRLAFRIWQREKTSTYIKYSRYK